MFLECDKVKPKTGYFRCDSKYFAVGSTCHFNCPLGTLGPLPRNAQKMTCKATISLNGNIISYDWTKKVSSFRCVAAMR